MTALLLSRGASAKAAHEFGWSPLHTTACCSWADMEIFELLIESGGFDTLCLKTSEGCTPLHLAVIWSFHEATRFHRDTATSLTAGRDKKNHSLDLPPTKVLNANWYQKGRSSWQRQLGQLLN